MNYMDSKKKLFSWKSMRLAITIRDRFGSAPNGARLYSLPVFFDFSRHFTLGKCQKTISSFRNEKTEASC